VQLPEDAVLIGIDGVPEDIFVSDGRINLILSAGDWRISHFLPPTPQEPTPLQQPATNFFSLVGVPLAALSVVAYFLIVRRRKRSHTLRPDDDKILEYVKSHGGEAYESDIARDLDMPKSTVWRAIRRLSEADLATTSREGNKVKVKAK
jgi:uncharacterized membrane protein